MNEHTARPAPRVYAQRLGVLAPDQFQAALARFDLGDFVEAAPVSGGLFGQNVFLFSPLSPADCAAFDLPTTACAFGMDLFIGESSRWNRGLGTTYVQLAPRYLVDVCAASYITLDPRVDNLRAIRCYEKCGFRRRKLLAQHEYHQGAYRDCWLMVYTQPE